MQILARKEAEDKGAHEALILNDLGHVCEGTASNLFWIENDDIFTPPLSSGVLPGVTRKLIFQICESESLVCREKTIALEQLRKSTGIFLTLSSFGIIEAESLDEFVFPTATLIARLQRAFSAFVANQPT